MRLDRWALLALGIVLLVWLQMARFTFWHSNGSPAVRYDRLTGNVQVYEPEQHKWTNL